MCKTCHNCFITLQVVTSGSKVTLPDNARLKKDRITSVMLRRSGAATLKTINGTTIAPDTVINNCHLVVKNASGVEITAPLPLSVLQRDYNAPEPLCVSWQGIDPQQTEITIDTSAAGYSASHAIEIIFGIECSTCNM